MLKELWWVLVFIVIFMIGCTTNEELGNQYMKEIDAQYMYMNNNSEQYITASSEGYYFVNGLYLYYCDFNSMEPTVLCNKPECLHDKELDETKKYNCNAFLLTGFSSKLLTIYDGYIYCYIEQDIIKDKDINPQLIRISLDGSNRKTICKLEENITSMALHRGKLYYSVSNIQSDEEGEDNGVCEYKLKVYNLFNNSSKPKTIYEREGLGAVINDIMPIGNKLRYTVYSLENGIFLGREKLYCIKEKTITSIGEDINVTDMGTLTTDGSNFIFTPIYISNEGIKYDDYMYTEDIETGVTKKLFKRSFSDIMHYSDDRYIYVDNILSFNYENEDYSDFTRTITVYDKEGNEIDCIDATGVSEYAYFIGGDEKYMFVKGENTEGAYIKYIDKSKIGTGKAKLETLFEIEREYLDPTVRVILE